MAIFGKSTSIPSVRGSNRSRGHVPSLTTQRFLYGTNTYDEPNQVPRGAAVAPTLNFITRGTKIEIRNGYAAVGPEVNGSGSVPGIFTAHRWDGSEILYKASGNSLYYYDDVTTFTWIEVGTNILTGGNGELIWMDEYASAAGAQLWISSTHTDLIKILTANPGSYSSQYVSAKNFKGSIRIKKNRMFCWNYFSTAIAQATKNTLQLSFIDAQNYTTVTAELLATGNGAQTTFAGVLAFKAGGPMRTCFAIQVSESGTEESFVDDYLGNLVGNQGGTGTINYMTGAYSITFKNPPTNGETVNATYQWEDSTNGGIADFSRSAPRTAGQGNSFVQNTGGAILNVLTLQGTEYCLHERNVWYVTISSDDSTATQDIFRELMSLGSPKGAVATADGIYYVDTTDKSNPYIALIEYSAISQLAYPKPLSLDILDLSGYIFDKSVAFQWDSFILFACRTVDSVVNNRIILYNRNISTSKIRVFDFVDFFAEGFAIKAGALIAGDSATINVFNLFANFDDDGAIPNANWTGGIDNLGIVTLKKVRKFWIEGQIDPGQNTLVQVSTDRSGFVTIGTISGTGAYVDNGQQVEVGSVIVGYNPVGGLANVKMSYHYIAEIRLNNGSFSDRQIRFVPQGVGYFSVTRFTDQDINYHQDKLPARYRQKV